MTITKALLEARLAELAKAKEQLVAHLNALIGAQQAYTTLLADLETEPKADEAPHESG